jgi:hypothetical protein
MIVLGSIPIARSNPRHRCPLGANSALGRVSRSMFVEIGCHLGIGWLGATRRTDWLDVFFVSSPTKPRPGFPPSIHSSEGKRSNSPTLKSLPRPALEWNTLPRLKYGLGIFSKRPGHCSRVVDPRKMTRSGYRSGHNIRSIESRCPPSSLTDDAVLIAPQA